MLCMWTQEYFKDMPNATLEHLMSALEHGNGERKLEHIVQELMEGTKQIWIGTIDGKFVATVVTHIIDYPSKKTCEVCYLGGESGTGVLDALGELSVIEEWAELQGCDDMQVYGRRGWLKALKKYDYSERYTIVGKPLGNSQNNKGSKDET